MAEEFDLTQQSIEKAIDDFKKAFTDEKTAGKEDAYFTSSQNTLTAVAALLKSFNPDDESEKFIQMQASKNTNSDPNARVDSKNTNAALPSYNLRTPYVELALNGIPLYPYYIPLDYSKDGNQGLDSRDDYQNRQLVQNLNISFPLSNDDITIRGSVKLFVRDPSDILAILDPYFPMADKNAVSGLPTVRLRFGWHFAVGEGKTESIRLVTSRELSMSVMGISLQDLGGGAGFSLTLQLQDHGTAVMQNSSGDFGITSNYPQEQLRTLIEGLLKIRLFTLDDLLALGSKPGDDTKPVSKTFFVSTQNKPLRLNSNTIYTLSTELAAHIRCRWYTVDNTKLAKEINQDESVRRELTKLQDEKIKTGKTGDLDNKIRNKASQLSARCRLHWIPNFPAGYKTTSNNFYKVDLETEGAFLLLPEVTDSPDLSAASLPLIYGPGASSFPYLYGSAMNVFNTMLHAQGDEGGLGSQTFGDVISINASYNSLLGELKAASDNESVSVKEVGSRLQREDLVKTNRALALTKEERDKIIEERKTRYKDTLDNIQKLAGQFKNVTERNKLLDKMDSRKKNSAAWQQTGAHRALIQGDPYNPSPAVSGNDKSEMNFEPVVSTGRINLVGRLATFLQYPYNISMTVLGDPTLLPNGIGSFELLAYFPSDIQAGKTTQKINYFLTGVYMPQTITHDISAGKFTTTIQAHKIPGLDAIPINSFTAALLEEIDSAQKDRTVSSLSEGGEDTGTAGSTKLETLTNRVLNIDLNNYENNPFLKSPPGNEDLRLSNLLLYIEEAQKAKKTN